MSESKLLLWWNTKFFRWPLDSYCNDFLRNFAQSTQQANGMVVLWERAAFLMSLEHHHIGWFNFLRNYRSFNIMLLKCLTYNLLIYSLTSSDVVNSKFWTSCCLRIFLAFHSTCSVDFLSMLSANASLFTELLHTISISPYIGKIGRFSVLMIF